MTLLTHEQQKKHSDSNQRSICKKEIYLRKNNKYYKNFMKVRDHDHYTGIYRGAAHSICKWRYATKEDIPVIIKNGCNYDFPLIIQELAKEFRPEIHCIPEEREKYKIFSIPIMRRKVNDKTINYNLRFIESDKFMMGSLMHMLITYQNYLIVNVEIKINSKL